MFNVIIGVDNMVFYVDGFYCDLNDYEIFVVFDIDDLDGVYVVENSNEELSGFMLGISYLFD